MDKRCAPVRGRTVLAALAAILAFSAVVLALHWVNAASLRGTADAGTMEPLDLAAEGGEALVEAVFSRGGALCVSGALLRPAQEPRAWRVRAALSPEGAPDELILLNTQMVRRYDLAEARGVDDHCGFFAAARLGALQPGEYGLSLVDASDGEARLIRTGVRLRVGPDGAERAE